MIVRPGIIQVQLKVPAALNACGRDTIESWAIPNLRAMGVSRMSIAVAALALAASALLQMAPHYWMYLPYGKLRHLDEIERAVEWQRRESMGERGEL